MSIAGKVVEIIYYTEDSPLSLALNSRLAEAEIHLQGEYGLQKFTIRNPNHNMDFLMGKFLWGNNKQVFFGDTEIAERVTTTAWIMNKGWAKLVKALQELDAVEKATPVRRRINLDD